MPEITANYQTADGRDFPVEWESADDTQHIWFWDSEHCPNPLTPLSVDFADAWWRQPGTYEAFAWMQGRPAGDIVPNVFPNGFMYMQTPSPSDTTSEPDEATVERQRGVSDQAPRMLQLWESQSIPQIRAVCDQLQHDNYASMSLSELAGRMDGYIENAAWAFSLTMAAAMPMMYGRSIFGDFCRSIFGPEAAAVADLLIEGFPNDAAASDLGLWDLAQKAEALPDVMAVFRENTPDQILAKLPYAADGHMFLADLQRYLNLYGWKSEFWWEIGAPTWQDDPSPALAIVRGFLAGAQRDPNDALRRSLGRRVQLTERLESMLESKEEQLQEFHAFMSMARQYVPLRESRALWQANLGGSLRVPCQVLGSKLLEAGILQDPDDVFYLHVQEIQSIADGDSEYDWPATVASRREERQSWIGAFPPETIGARSPAATPAVPVAAVGDTLRGNGASPGIVTGPAKIVRTLDEAAKVQQGDILICRSTSPAWTPFFTQIAAVVTDTGGILSHSAIVAREFAIPCVVGVRHATEILRDGMILTVDGGQGTITIGE